MDALLSELLSQDPSKQLAALQLVREKLSAEAVKGGVLPAVIKLIQSPDDQLRQQATLVFGLIWIGSPDRKTRVDQNTLVPFLEELANLLASNDPSTVAQAAHILFFFTKSYPKMPYEYVSRLLPSLLQLILNEKDEKILHEAISTLLFLDKTPDKLNQHIIESGVAKRLVELHAHSSDRVQSASLKVLGNIASGAAEHTQAIIDYGLLPNLSTMLQDNSFQERTKTKREICWMISNIAAGNRQQAQAVIDAKLIPVLINLLPNESADVQKEIVWTFGNIATVGTPAQLGYVVSLGALALLCGLLSSDNDQLLVVVLETLDNTLKIGQKEAQITNGTNKFLEVVEKEKGVEKLKELQNHKNRKISSKAETIIETYVLGTFQSAPPSNVNNGFCF